jgi:hypothetical protein
MTDTTDLNKALTGLVSIACKLPSGLTISHAGKTVTLNGANSEGAIVGFGITKNVDADWFAAWAAESRHSAVESGSIFANTGSKIAGEAKEKRDDITTGMEPLNGDKPGVGVERVAPIGG